MLDGNAGYGRAGILVVVIGHRPDMFDAAPAFLHQHHGLLSIEHLRTQGGE